LPTETHNLNISFLFTTTSLVEKGRPTVAHCCHALPLRCRRSCRRCRRCQGSCETHCNATHVRPVVVSSKFFTRQPETSLRASERAPQSAVKSARSCVASRRVVSVGCCRTCVLVACQSLY